jgi:phenylpyruvate tautomerase PptA (4-oxalocrotonate tautomerase family)
MAGIKFTDEQIEELSKNKVIKDITSKMMTFTKDFKRKAVAETA